MADQDPRFNPDAKAELDKAMGRTPTSGDPDSKSTGVPKAPESPPPDPDRGNKMADHLKAFFSGKTETPPMGAANPANAAALKEAGVQQAVNSGISDANSKPANDHQ